MRQEILGRVKEQEDDDNKGLIMNLKFLRMHLMIMQIY